MSQPGSPEDQPATVEEIDTFLAAFAVDPLSPERTEVTDRLLDLRRELLAR